MSTGTQIVTSHLQLSRTSTASVVSSISSSASTSTASTEWGPGTVMGRLLLGFGEAVKGGIDSMIIRRRLVTIRNRFPHKDSEVTSFKNMEQAYDDLLELSRSSFKIVSASLI